MIVEILVGGIVTVLFREIRDRRARRRGFDEAQLSHYPHGLVLPAVDDPSWKVQSGAVSCYNMPCHRNKMVMGKIRACMDHGVHIDDMGLDQVWPEQQKKFIAYARAVRRSVCDRMVQESVDDTRWKRLLDKQEAA